MIWWMTRWRAASRLCRERTAGDGHCEYSGSSSVSASQAVWVGAGIPGTLQTISPASAITAGKLGTDSRTARMTACLCRAIYVRDWTTMQVRLRQYL